MTGIYSENGWVAKVRIIENMSDDEWEKYSLEVVETIADSPIFKTPLNGHTFEVSAQRKYRGYIDWDLQLEN